MLSPACNLYVLDSEFKHDNKKGKTFGVSRDVTYHIKFSNHQRTGSLLRTSLSSQAQGSTSARKTHLVLWLTLAGQGHLTSLVTYPFNSEHRTTSKYNPGPGAYEAPCATPGDGKTFYSKFRSTQFAKINHSPRFNTAKDSPGPHSYDVRNNFSREGKYILSGNRGEGTRAFSQTARAGFTDTISKNSISNNCHLYRPWPRALRKTDGIWSLRRHQVLQDSVRVPQGQLDH